jgi:hypothetical protein
MSILLGLGLGAKLLGLGGTGVLGLGARLLGFDKKVFAAAQKLPSWVWIALAVIAVLVAGYFIHRHEIREFRTSVQRAQMAADNDFWKKKLAAAHADALSWKQKAEAKAASISNQERTRDEEAIRNHAAAAGDLSLRGPGAAASHCGPIDHPEQGAGPGGHGQATAIANAAGSEMSSGDWALVPWSWLVQRAQEHDDGLSENVAWRSNDARHDRMR